MKSVCVIVQHCYDIDIRVRRKAQALVAEGYSVDVLGLQGPTAQSHYTVDGVNVYTIALGKKRGSQIRYAFEYFFFLAWAMMRLTFMMPRRKYSLVEINTLPDFLVFAAIFARWMGAKVVLDMHEITPEFYMSKYGIPETSIWIRMLKFQERISFNYADNVITINQPIQDLLEGRGLAREKSTIIMNSADESRFANFSKAATKDPNKFVMMYHGTLTRIYGLDLAIEAFAQVHEQMPGAEFCILGSGTEKEALGKLAEERGIGSKVKLLGQVLPGAIPEYLSKCDVGILPIRSDVFLEFASPNKLPEFIIMGIPVIISRLRAIRSYFSEDALAFCTPNTPEDLGKQMLRVYRDAGLRASLVAKAKEEYAPISWDVMKKRYVSMVENIVGPAHDTEPSAMVQSVGGAQSS
jgi:glycosyltransferase involved in cell wall biosynthesis